MGALCQKDSKVLYYPNDLSQNRFLSIDFYGADLMKDIVESLEDTVVGIGSSIINFSSEGIYKAADSVVTTAKSSFNILKIYFRLG